MEMFRRTVNCPLCFEKVNVSDIGFKCCSPTCRSSVEFFRTKAEIPLLEKLGVVAAPKRMRHTCGEMATERICPNCKREIPISIEDFTDLRIAIVGANGSGKSIYVTMLIHWIKCMEAEFGWTLTALTEETISQYRAFHDCLFKRHEVLCASHVICNTYRHSPLVYVLHVRKGMLSKRIMLVFLDVPGENLSSPAFLPHVSRYICNASGIICIVDPLQIGCVRKIIAAKYGKDVLPMQDIDSSGIIMGRIADVIRANTPRGKKIKIPLAVAFSKIEGIQGVVDNGVDISQRILSKTRHCGVFNESEFADIDGMIRSWIEKLGDAAGIIGQSESFAHRGFFGFSAIGSGTRVSDGHLGQDPRSLRVEDPFLWLLHLRGLVKSMKG
jgi:hypothetical protein